MVHEYRREYPRDPSTLLSRMRLLVDRLKEGTEGEDKRQKTRYKKTRAMGIRRIGCYRDDRERPGEENECGGSGML